MTASSPTCFGCYRPTSGETPHIRIGKHGQLHATKGRGPAVYRLSNYISDIIL